MALAEHDYEGQLREFNSKYGMEGYDLKQTAQIDERFRYVNSFLMKDSIEGPSGQFIYWFSKVARNYFEKHSQFSSDWKKNLSKFHAQDFLDDFEKVAKAKYLSELEAGQDPDRKAYAGAKIKQIITAIAPYFQEINKPLPTVWMERMKKGKMDIKEIQQTCVNLTENLKVNLDQKAESMKNFTRIVAAREAVKQLRESRPHGFLGAIWWLFNFRINARERDCLETLNGCIKKWEAKQFNTENVLNELTGKTALGRPVNVAQQASQPSAEAEVNQASKQEVKAPQMSPVAKQLDEALRNVDAYAMAQELNGKLPKNSQENEVFRTMAFQTMWKIAIKNIGQINADFDSAIATGADPQTEMDNVVRKVFVDVSKSVKSWGDYSDNAGKNEATKIMAKMIIERHTVLALHSDKLGDVVNGYVEQYTATMKELSAKNKDFVQEMETFEFNRINGISNKNNEIKSNNIIADDEKQNNNESLIFDDDDSDIEFEDDMNLDFGDNNIDIKEKVFDEANPFVENGEKIAPQVSQEPKQNAPILNNGNK